MKGLARRLIGVVLMLGLLAGGLAVAVVYGIQTSWGADRIAAVLRGWGYPVDRFRIDDLGWDRVTIDGIIVDGGALSVDRLEIGLRGSWLDMPGALSGPDPAALDRIAITGLRARMEIDSDGTVRVPALAAFGTAPADREVEGGLPVTVDDLTIADAQLAVLTPFADLSLTLNGSGAIRPDTLLARADGEASLVHWETGEGQTGIGEGRFEVAVDRGADGAYVIDFSSRDIDLSGMGALPALSGGSFWASLETAPDMAISRLAFRAEAETGPPTVGSGRISARVTGDLGRYGLRTGLDIAIGTTAAPAAWFTIEGRADSDTVRHHVPPGVLSDAMIAMAPDEVNASGSNVGLDAGIIDIAVDGALADWPQARRLLLAAVPGLTLPDIDAVPEAMTSAIRADLMLREDRLAAGFDALSASHGRPSAIAAAIGDAVVDGMIGIDAGRTVASPSAAADAIVDPSVIRGAFRLNPADGGVVLTVAESATVAGLIQGSPFDARIDRGSTMAFRPDNEPADTDQDPRDGDADLPLSGSDLRPAIGRFGIEGELFANLRLADASINSGDDGIAFGLSMPETENGIGLSDWGTYTILAPSLDVDVAPLVEATTGPLGLVLEPVSVALGGQGRLDRPSARVTIRSAAAVDRSDVMAGATAAATVDVAFDPDSGIISVSQDGCATVSIADMMIPDGLRLAAPLELCLELESQDARLTFLPALDYWPRETLRFGVDRGETVLTGWARDADRAEIAWSSMLMAFERGELLPSSGSDAAAATGPPVFRIELGDTTVDLGSSLGAIDGADLSIRASGQTVDATLSGSWATAMFGRRQRYAVRSNLTSDDGGRGDIRITGPAGMPVITATGRYEGTTGRVLADWRVQPIDLATVADPSTLVPALGTVSISEQMGNIAARGRVVWDGALGASGILDFTDVGFATPFGSLSGLSASLRADRILPLPISIPAGQPVTVDSVDLGFVLENGSFGFGLSGDTVRVDDLRFVWAGGTVSAHPITTRLSDRERVIVLEVEGVRLAELLDDVPADGLSITGSVSGHIPLRLTNDTVYIDDGVLISDGPGRLSYVGDTEAIPGAVDAPSDGGGLDILFRALENFRYERLTMTLDGQTGYNLELGLIIEGANPDLYDGYPVKLNVGVSGALDEILRRGLETTRIGREAEDLLREFDGEIDDDELLRRLRDLER